MPVLKSAQRNRLSRSQCAAEPASCQDHISELLLGSTEVMDPTAERKNGRPSERAVAKAALTFENKAEDVNTSSQPLSCKISDLPLNK